MVKENVLFFRTRQEKPLTLSEPEKQKKKHSSCVIANKSFCLSSTLELREKETGRQFRMNGKLWRNKMFLFFSHSTRKTAHFWQTRETKKKNKTQVA